MTRASARPSRHLLAALVAVAASFAAPLLVADDGVSVTTGNVTARAAQAGQDARPGAERFPLGSPDFELAHRVAREHWGADACKGQVALTWVSLDPATNATASWRNPTDAWANAGENFDCRIELNTNARYDLPKLCTVLAHELGHLLGQPHTAEPRQLMSPIYSDPLPACDAASPAAAPAPAPEPAPAPAPSAPPEAAVAAAEAGRSTAAARPTGAARTMTRTARTAKAVRVTDRRIRGRALRRARTRCLGTLRAGRRTKRCARLVRMARRAQARVRTRS